LISRIKIANYRSIETLEFHPGSLCALVGENNAGKSNILRALKMVLAKDWLNVRDFDTNDVHRHDSGRDVCIEIEFDPAPVYEGFSIEGEIPVPIFRYTLTRYKKATKSARKGDLRLTQEALTSKEKPVSVLQSVPKKGESNKYRPLTNIPSDVKKQVPVIYVGADRRLADQLPTSRYSLLRRLLEDVAESLTDKVVPVSGGGEEPLLVKFNRLMGEALSVLHTQEFVELEGLVRERSLHLLGYDPSTEADRFALRLGLFEALDFFKSLRLVVDENGIAVDALDMGDGAQSAITVAIFSAYQALKKSGAIFLIEEPELHLHPHKSRYFYNTLRELSKTNQVIYTTHSPHFVAVPHFDDVRLVYRDESGNTALREPTIEVTPQIREKLIKELDPERNELFFAKRVILVEGDTEKLALPEYAKRMGIDLDREGVSLVEVGGKKSLPLFVSVIRALGLPMMVLFDEDSSDFDRKDKDKEQEFNEMLMGSANDSISVQMFKGDYEAELRKEVGSDQYEEICQRYPKMSKAVRARLIALDTDIAVPMFVAQAIEVSLGRRRSDSV